MEKVRYLTLLLLIILLSFQIHAQNSTSPLDLAITKAGEKISGNIKIYPSRIVVIDTNNKKIDLKAEQIEVVFLSDNSKYNSIEISVGSDSSTFQLVRIMVEGYVKLYELNSQGVSNYYFKKGNEKLVKINAKYFPNYVKLLTTGCDSSIVNCENAKKCVIENYQNITFSVSKLIDIVSNYNKCIEPEQEVKINRKSEKDFNSGSGLRIFAEAGIGRSSYGFAFIFNGKGYGNIDSKYNSAVMNFIIGTDYQIKKFVIGGEVIYERFFDSNAGQPGAGNIKIPRDRIFYTPFVAYTFKVANNLYLQPQINYSIYDYAFGSKEYSSMSSGRFAYGAGVKLLFDKLYINVMYRKVNFRITESGTGLEFEKFESKMNTIFLGIGYRLPVLAGKS